jgi:4-phospho-D-threonate 3-dehydrogenase / 4-phospho-D-erythronate 3-dehydrogenase
MSSAHSDINTPGGWLPRVAVPMGDPAGIGPEIVVKALAHPDIYEACVPVVIGDARFLAGVPGWAGEPRIVAVSDVEDARPVPGFLAVLDLDTSIPASFRIAEASAEGGKASIAYLTRGVELALAGKVDAVASAPLNKAAMKQAGFNFPDEYDYMAHLCGDVDYTMLAVSPHFTLASVVMHVAMKDMPALVTRARVLATIRRSNLAAKATGVNSPRIGVAALNPHGGEGGLTGREEIEEILPAIKDARREGIDAHGPFPADTFFVTVKEHAYDVYVGMYHDQGRIPMKVLDFGQVVTIAAGLPMPFCTTGHGTAFNIAGKGVAKEENTRQAILLAARQAVLRRAADAEQRS